MSISHYPGFLAIAEGPDGSGKTSAMRALANHLRANPYIISNGIEVIETRNIGGTELAEELRALIINPQIKMDALQQLILITAARRSNLEEVILPALRRGAYVLCDRFVGSALVYQTLTSDGPDRVTQEDVIELHERFCNGLKPDMTWHISAPATVRLARRQARNEGHDRFDNGDLEFDERVAEAYRTAGPALGHVTVDIDASGTAEDTVNQMIAQLHLVRPELGKVQEDFHSAE